MVNTRVTHIHVHAPHQVLGERYSERESGLRELSSYEEVTANATEAAVTKLADDADVSIDSDRCLELDVQTRAAAALRLLPSRSARLVDVIVGGGYGSEGKGNIAFYLAPEYQVLMRSAAPTLAIRYPRRRLRIPIGFCRQAPKRTRPRRS